MHELIPALIAFLILVIIAAIYMGIVYLVSTAALGLISCLGLFIQPYLLYAKNLINFLLLVVVSALQTYLYLFHIAFVVHNTTRSLSKSGADSMLVSAMSLAVSILPIFFIQKNAYKDSDDPKYETPTALYVPYRITLVLSVIAYFLFAIYPGLMKILWSKALFSLW